MTPAVLAALLPEEAAPVAAALAAATGHPFPSDPVGLYVAARRARLDEPAVLSALRGPGPGRPVLGLVADRVAARLPASPALCWRRADGVTVCPPRTHALDPLTDRPRPAPGAAPPPPRRRSRSSRSDRRVVTYVAPENPKKPGSACALRFQLYEVGLTVDECLARGVTRADVRWDLDAGFIRAELPSRDARQEQRG